MKKEELDISLELIKKSLKEEKLGHPCLCENLSNSLEGGICYRHEIIYAGSELKKLLEHLDSETRISNKFEGEIGTYKGIKVVISK